MDFLEKELEDIIFEHLDSKDNIKKLRKLGLKIDPRKPTIIKRQLRIGNYGTADIVTILRHKQRLYVDIFELKRDIIDIDSLIQIIRYQTGIKRYLDSRDFNYNVRLYIIGKKLRTNDGVYLFEEVDNLSIYAYELDIDGLSFRYDHLGYKLTKE